MSEVRAGDTGQLVCVEGIIDAMSSVPSLGEPPCIGGMHDRKISK